MVQKCLKFWCKINQWKYFNRIYSQSWHALHNYYPLAPEQLAISYDMLSKYSKNIAEKYGIKVDDVKKLVANLGNKLNT